MKIVHELGQLEYGGVEKIIKSIIKYDTKNEHFVVTYKDGPFRKEFEKLGTTILMAGNKEIDFMADIAHIHTGGAQSIMAFELGKSIPIIETIHSPVRSPMPDKLIKQRVGVTSAVCQINSNCIPILNGVDLGELETDRYAEDVKRELRIPEGIPIIGRLGRIGKDKCLEEWLLTCYYLQMQGIEFVPLIVGGEASGLNGYIGKLKLMAESLPVKNIVWAGHKSDVANYLQLMDIFLYPSPTEGFGLVFAEAMHAGAVLVTYKNEVTLEVAGGYSILTENSIDGLVMGVKKALDINVRDAIIPIAHDFVDQELNAKRMVSEYQEVYERIV